MHTFKTIKRDGFFDRHPILVPASIFFICWIPYLIIFLRRDISFGDLGSPYPIDTWVYWLLFVIQLGVCVISHSLTIRTIVRLYAPFWLIWGSVAFYALSPAWGIMTAADIRHPLFAAVFCVFVSSSVFAMYSKSVPKWLWVQLAGGALCVCLLRDTGVCAVIPTLFAIFVFKFVLWRKFTKTTDSNSPISSDVSILSSVSEAQQSQSGQSRQNNVNRRELWTMEVTPNKKEESIWSGVCAAFLVLSCVGLLVLISHCFGWGLPLGEPSYGAVSASAVNESEGAFRALGMNLTGTHDVAGIIPFADISSNSYFADLAMSVSQFFYQQQCFPVVNLTFSWAVFVVFFCVFAIFALYVFLKSKRAYDIRPMILVLPMAIVLVFMAVNPTDATLRYMMPVLAAQPMMIGACFASWRSI